MSHASYCKWPIGQICHKKIILNLFLFLGIRNNNNNPPNRQGEWNWPKSRLNDSEPQERGLLRVKVQTISQRSMPLDPPGQRLAPSGASV